MFCGVATSTAKTGKMDQLIAAASEHAEALRREPGCVAAYVLREREGSGQLSMSIFESEEAFARAVNATRPVIARHHLEELVERPPEFHFFEVC